MTLTVGQKASAEFKITDEMVRAFAELSGDKNPVHLDEEFAKTTAFKKRIAHGMISGALISSAIANKLPGPGSIYLGQNLKFTSAVFLGETVVVDLTISQLREDKPIATITTQVFAGPERRLVVDGEAVVRYPRH